MPLLSQLGQQLLGDFMKNLFNVSAIVLLTVLAGCGGGGGGSTSNVASNPPVVTPTPPVTVPFQTAMANRINNGVNKSFTISGWYQYTSVILTGSGTLVENPAIVTTIPALPGGIGLGSLTGTVALEVTGSLTETIFCNGATFSSTNVVTAFYNTSDYTGLETVVGPLTAPTLASVNQNLYGVPGDVPYPSTVAAGDAGTFGTAQDSQGNQYATYYSVASDSANSLLVTVTTVEFMTNNISVKTQELIRVDTLGNSSFVSITVDTYTNGVLTMHQVDTF
jgi:hypothetical protein